MLHCVKKRNTNINNAKPKQVSKQMYSSPINLSFKLSRLNCREVLQLKILSVYSSNERQRKRKGEREIDICHQAGWADRSRSLQRNPWNACCRLESSGGTEEPDRRINLRRSPRNRSRDLSAKDDPAASGRFSVPLCFSFSLCYTFLLFPFSSFLSLSFSLSPNSIFL